MHGRTHDGRLTKCDHKSSPCHCVTGELKIIDHFELCCLSEFLAANNETRLYNVSLLTLKQPVTTIVVCFVVCL